MSIFTKFFTGVGKVLHAIAHFFAADILPVAIDITQEFNEAVKSGDAQTVVNILKGIAPTVGSVAQVLLDKGQVLAPKLLASELGLQALESGATPETEIAWAQSLIDAYGSASLVRKSKVWNNLATELAILYDNGRTTDKTWIDWAKTVEAAFQAIQKAIADDKADQEAAN